MKMIECQIRLLIESPTLLDVSLLDRKPRAIPTTLRGVLRRHFREMFGDESELEFALFGAEQRPGALLVADNFHFEGVPNEFFRVAIDPITRAAREDFLRTEIVVPAGAMIIGTVWLDIERFEHVSVFEATLHAMGKVPFRFGMRMNHGFGLCTLEIIDLKSTGKVFISYSRDSDEHMNWVLVLADRFSKEGIEIIFDAYDLKFGDNIHYYMEQAIAQSDKVLIVLTPTYKDKFMMRRGGVGYESSMIVSDLYGQIASNNKFIPILRYGDQTNSIPAALQPYLFCDMRDDCLFEIKFTELFSAILDKPSKVRPRHNKFRDTGD